MKTDNRKNYTDVRLFGIEFMSKKQYMVVNLEDTIGRYNQHKNSTLKPQIYKYNLVSHYVMSNHVFPNTNNI